MEKEHILTSRQIISDSLEDYLEAIFHIVGEKQAARAKDIAQRLQVKASSVTGALRLLADKGLINYAPYDLITLTPVGKRLAKDVILRHETLREFFTKVLAVDQNEAEEAACKMEHAIPGKIVDRLVQYLEFVERCPRCRARWLSEFDSFCEAESVTEDCEPCIAECLQELRQDQP